MKDYKNRKESEKDDVVENLLRQPVKNLEQRVKELDIEIEERLKLNVETLTKLGTQQISFNERARQLHYSAALGNTLSTKSHFEIEVSKIEVQKNREMLDCFRDISKLREQLVEARQNLEKERLKLKLVE